MHGCAADAGGNPRPDDKKIVGEVADAIKRAELKSPQIIYDRTGIRNRAARLDNPP